MLRVRDDGWQPEQFAAFLNRVIRQTGIKPPQLADLAGISRPQIYRWINGDSRPGYDALVRLGDILHEQQPGVMVGRREALAAAGYEVEELKPPERADRHRNPRKLAPSLARPPRDYIGPPDWDVLPEPVRAVWYLPDLSPEERLMVHMFVAALVKTPDQPPRA